MQGNRKMKLCLLKVLRLMGLQLNRGAQVLSRNKKRENETTGHIWLNDYGYAEHYFTTWIVSFIGTGQIEMATQDNRSVLLTTGFRRLRMQMGVKRRRFPLDNILNLVSKPNK